MKPHLPKLLPLKSLDWTRYIRKMGDARQAVTEFNSLLKTIPNSSVLLSPLTKKEAVLSSKIEGTTASLQEVLEFEVNPTLDVDKKEDIQEILNYRKAMYEAEKLLNKYPVSTKIINKMHGILMQGVRGKSKSPGKFRRIQVQVGTPITYMPPEVQYLEELMSNLDNYINYDEQDKIVQLAIVHAQFEMIHPYMDGNGRTGRLLLPLFLFEKKIISSPNFYLSEYLEINRKEYYSKLDNISKKDDWDSWIEFFLTAVIEQSQKNTEKVNEILSYFREMINSIKNITHSQYTYNVAEVIFSYPFFTINQFRDLGRIPSSSSKTILNKLASKNIIKKVIPNRGNLPAIYSFPKLLEIINR